ncbi:carotenoid biosynthesis protein [Mucilaginibacter arboris]|uniref:Carotenoid biosynthesis protein n=1 Tax=Mucilaginibacter arboris TaxID=2682090 RepID=A0A7K1T0Z8_9SPHI|nr:carotenoid biosynthesis protein [Mucilaginibacter arboris]MVN23225.1 carotenoid biosynthesis protein [Mucilaginibacter arboris]
MKLNKKNVSIVLIVLFHFVGLIGFFVPFLQPLFLQLVPFHLLLMLFLVLINHHGRFFKLLLFALIIITAGFAAEWTGVHKHWLFGNYVYGKTLGFKVDEIPLIIGINWFLLIYSTSVLLQKLSVKTVALKVISGSVILVLLDLILEPVAIRFDYWNWLTDAVPVKNYICWCIVSLSLLTVFQYFNFRFQNWVAPVLLLVQFVFFAVLNFA